MSLIKRFASLAGALIFLLATAYADGGEWRVAELSGSVRIAQSMTGVQLVSTGETLRGGAVLSTGLDGRAVLVRGPQTIVVGPNSRMSLPVADEKGMTRILQDVGTMMFKVDKRQNQHFRVETPVIAAVVKGTTFTVTAGVGSHAVHVAEGLVEVIALDGGESMLVGAGETVQVSTADHSFTRPDIGGRDENNDETESTDVTPSENGKRAELLIPADIGREPLDFADLTDGLVRSGNAAAPAFDGAGGGGIQTAALAGGNAGPLGASNAGGGVGLGNVNNGVGLGVNGGIGLGNGNNGVGLGVDGGIGLGNGNNGVGLGVDGGIGLGNGGAGVGDGGGVGVGGGGVDVGVGAGGGGVDVGLDVGLGDLDVGLDLDDDQGLDLDLDDDDQGGGLLGGLLGGLSDDDD